MAKILLVEDNENVREAAAGYLKLEGYEVEEYGAIKPAEKFLDSPAGAAPDLILLDVMLPDGDGFLFAKRIKEKRDIPIIFLTARDQESDRITGLELGADDYVVKPFSTKELVLRVKAVLKRSGGSPSSADVLHSYELDGGRLQIVEDEHRILLDGTPLLFTAAEWNILLFLAEKSPQVFNRVQLLEYCLNSVAEGSERTIDTHVKNIRAKLGDGGWIETVRGFGFRFNGRRV